nr:MAG TPA: hypothetical protein [Caudoviricetes sp.]
MAKTVKEAKADIFLRDTDSQSLFNNSGVLSFKYYHEWNDCYNQVTGETAQIAGEVYDETTNSYKPNCPEGFSPVFNGRLSALWDNIVNCFPNEVEAMYVKMRGNGLTYQDMLTKYKDFWKYWCENLYNADAFGYANTNNFTKAYGDKVQVMDYFFGKRQRYLDSKYHCGSSVGNNLRLRLYEVGRGFAIKHYQAIYCTLQWGVGNFDDNRNIKPGTYSYMPFKFSNPQDATFDVDDADLITELSTYARGSNGNYTIYGLEGLGDFKFDLNMGLLKRLTKFVMNYTASKPNTREIGTNFDLSKMGMLRQVIVRNVKNLKKSIILSSDLLEEIDFTNTPITGVTTPPTDMLTKLVLPDTIKELNLVGYTNLQVSGLQLAGYSNIETLYIEDCPNLDSYEIVKACYDAGAKLTNVILKGIDWRIDDTTMLLSLAVKGAKLQGKIFIESLVPVTIDDKAAFISAWGDIDNENNSLYISYNSIPITSISIEGREYIGVTGKFQFKVSTKPASGNNLRSIKWKVDENDFAEINASTGELEVKKIGTEDSNTQVTIHITAHLNDDSILNSEKKVNLFVRPIKLGDYLFSDFSYGSKLSDSDKHPIGICFYIDPNGREYAIAVALQDLQMDSWGIQASSLPNLSLKDSPNKDVYDIQDLENQIMSGSEINDSKILDSTNIRNDGFKDYNTVQVFGSIGFITITSTIYNRLKNYLDKAGLKINDKISYGQYKTLTIIAHRDIILNDSNINMPIPQKTANMSEKEVLSQYIQNIVTMNKDEYRQYYYPTASYSFAHTVSVDNDEIGLHKWYLPSSGEAIRFIWYHEKGYKFNSKYSIFSQGVQDKVFSPITSNYATSSEIDKDNTLGVRHISTGKYYCYSLLKGVYGVVRPVITFKKHAF